jgi:hypothetical protein
MRAKVLVLALTVAALTLALIATVALGDDQSRARAKLSGYQEVPTLSSSGNGEFIATIDDANQQINYTLTFGGFATAVQVAHIHLGQRATNGNVSAFLCGGGGQAACPPGGGTVTGTIGASNVLGPAAQGIARGDWSALAAAIRAGVAYANVHTIAFPAGEIRGQITVKNDEADRNGD